VLGAGTSPLCHPLISAKDLGTLDLLSNGRLVKLPTVSWHAEEYRALGEAGPSLSDLVLVGGVRGEFVDSTSTADLDAAVAAAAQ